MFPLTPTLSLNGEGVHCANRHYEETLKPCMRLSRSDTFTVAGIIERHESGSERNNLLSCIFPPNRSPLPNGEGVHRVNHPLRERSPYDRHKKTGLKNPVFRPTLEISVLLQACASPHSGSHMSVRPSPDPAPQSPVRRPPKNQTAVR